jgi:hypothetical protein
MMNKLWFCLCLFLAVLIFFCSPATALLRQHHESPGVLRYHALDSVRDRQDRTWQVVFFPESDRQTTKYYLRLVGFPGLEEFTHPQPLEIITSQGTIFTAPDVYAISSPAPNVAQYDLTSIIDRLPDSGTLKLNIMLQSDRNLSLKITKSIFAEWQLLVKQLEPNKPK